MVCTYFRMLDCYSDQIREGGCLGRVTHMGKKGNAFRVLVGETVSKQTV